MHPAASKAALAKLLDVQNSAADLPSNTERSVWNGKGESGVGEMLVIHVTVCIK